MTLLTPIWLGGMLAGLIYASFPLYRWVNAQSNLVSGIGLYCISLTMLGLLPIIALQLGLYLFDDNIEMDHSQISIQFYLSLCVLIAAWLSSREHSLGEPARSNPKSIKIVYFGLSLVMLPEIYFDPEQSTFVPNAFVYFLYAGIPAIMMGVAAYLFYLSKMKLSLVFSIFCLVMGSSFIGNWWFGTVQFIDYIMIECLAILAIIGFLIKETKYFKEGEVLSKLGQSWQRPSFSEVFIHPNIFSFFTITLFSCALISIVLYIPTKKAVETIEAKQLDKHAISIVGHLQSVLDQHEIFISSVFENTDLDVAKTMIGNMYELIAFNETVNADKKTYLTIKNGVLYGYVFFDNQLIEPVKIKMDMGSKFEDENIFITLNQKQTYEFKNEKWVKYYEELAETQHKKYYFYNAELNIKTNMVHWVDVLVFDLPMLVLLFTVLIVIYLLIAFKYSAIINTVKYISEALRLYPVDNHVLNMPMENNNEFSDLAKSIHTMQLLLKENNINLQQEIIIKNEMSDQIDIEKQRNEKVSRSKSEFLDKLSKELRGPMNGVVGVSQVLAKTNLDENQQENVQTIIKSGEMLLMILNDILDISEIESKTLSINNNTINIKTIITQVAEVFYVEARNKNIELLIDFKKDMNFEAVGDEVRIKQVLSNILNNAIKFTQEGYILISVDFDTVLKNIVISISDSGIGIEKNNINKIFDAFTQENATASQEYGGIGLGLSICKHLIELMSGSICVESNEYGSTFSLTMPLLSDHEVVDNEIWTEGKHILIVKSEFKGTELYRSFVDNKEGKIDLYSTFCNRNIIDWKDIGDQLLRLKEIESYDLIIVDFGAHYHYLENFYNALEVNESLSKLPILLVKDDSLSFNFVVDKYRVVSVNKPIDQSAIIENSYQVFDPQKTPGYKDLGLEKDVCFNASILVAEDTYLNQVIVTEILINLGFSVKVVENGELAVEEYKNNTFDLILMDCLMPIMDGFDATKIIREIEVNNKVSNIIPIVALTGNSLISDRDKCLSVGMNDFLSKPFIESDLIEILKQQLPLQYKNVSTSELIKTQSDIERNEDYISRIENEFSEINPIVFEKLLHFKQMMGVERYSHFIKKALEEIQKSLNMFIESDKKMNKEDMIRAIHALKSIASNFSFLKMSSFAQDLENSLVNNEVSNSNEKIKLITEYCNELSQILHKASQ